MKIHFPSHCADANDCRRGAPVKSALASSDASIKSGRASGPFEANTTHPAAKAKAEAFMKRSILLLLMTLLR
jgi:hypothetical protein